VIVATDHGADISRVACVAHPVGRFDSVDGFLVWDEAFATRPPGLYVTGFGATSGFGPFFGIGTIGVVSDCSL
jgi:hypothetical protein